jgi:hypothetical protein
MKSVFLFVVFCTVLHGQEVLDGTAAVVNDQTVSYSQLRERVAPKEKALRETLKGSDLMDAIKKLRKSELDQLVDRQLLLQKLKKAGHPLGADATDEQIDAAIKEHFQSNRGEWLKGLRPEANIKTY